MRIRGYALLLLALASCQSQPVKPLESSGDIKGISAEENRRWHEAREFDKAIRNLNTLYDDPVVRQYLQDVMDRLYPEFKGTIRVEIVKTPILNAFALPNGSIYMHIGLLARIDNEAQLAAILAHEGAHFIHKHGYLQVENVKTTSAIGLGIALAGIPVVGNIIAYSSIYGFSRELETEADLIAYQRMQKSRYDTREGAKVFEHLAAEMKALDAKEPYFFASHPKLQERIDNFREMHGKDGVQNGTVNAEEYLRITDALRLDSIRADLAMDRYKSMILVLEDAKAVSRFGPRGQYFLGEAYRRRNQDGDSEKALQAYQNAAQKMPDFAPTYRALGLHYMKKEEYAQARVHFEKYLQLIGAAQDAAYVKSYLQQIKQKGY